MVSPFASRFRSVGVTLGWRHNSESVVYSRGAESQSINAIGEDAPAQVDEVRPGQSFTGRKREWLVTATDLSAFRVPCTGDRICRVTGGHRETWEVFRDQQAREWDWDGTGNTVFRVRTKLMKDESA